MNSNDKQWNLQQNGFTLLEILISITLVAMVLGSLFALQASSSKLTLKAEKKIDENISLRAALNIASLTVEKEDVINEVLKTYGYRIANIQALEKPEDQTTPIKLQLEQFDITDQQGNILLTSVRFKKLKTVE